MPRDTWVKRVGAIGGIPVYVNERMPRDAVAFVQDNTVVCVIKNPATSEEEYMQERSLAGTPVGAKFREVFDQRANTLPNPSPNPSLIDGTIQSIQAARKELEDIRVEVQGFVSGTLGTEPEDGRTGGTAQCEPTCRAAFVENELGALHATIRELRSQVNRLARV